MADALHEGVNKLSRLNKSLKPEILALLLELSEKPATGTRIEDLALLKRPPTLPPLTWDQVLADDPLDFSKGIWSTIDYAEDSSEADDVVTPASTQVYPAKSASLRPDTLIPAELPAHYNISIESVLIRDITGVQFWRAESGSAGLPTDLPFLTETQIIREILFMLMRLPTNIFQNVNSSQSHIIGKYRIQRMSTEALEDIIASFISIGQQLASVRDWVDRARMVHMLQTLQAALRLSLQDIDRLLTKIETRLLHPEFQAPVTLLSVLSEVQVATRSILSIKDILTEQANGHIRKPFAVLESMYDVICSAESTSDETLYKFFGMLFFQCLRTYLKPVSAWIEFGEVEQDDEVLFIMKNKEEPSRESLWSNQYVLRYDPNGTLYAPHFLRLKAQKIFTSGKNVSFGRSLDMETMDTYLRSSSVAQIDFESVCKLDLSDVMRPFSDRFDSALNSWVNSKHQLSSLSLRKVLDSRCGLWLVLDALEYIYLSRNGALTSQVASGIFTRIDKGKSAWNDQYILTDLFRETYEVLDCVSTAQLFVRSKEDKARQVADRQRTMGSLASLMIGYKLPWAIANVLRPDSQGIYQRVFVLLLQVLRATELLGRKIPATIPTEDDARKKMVTTYLSLRHRLVWFVNTLHTYLTTTVLSQACSELRMKMEMAHDLDEMIAAHDTHVHRLENQCLLSKKLTSTQQAIISMLDLVVLFSDLWSSLGQQLRTRVDSTQNRHRGDLETSSDVDDDNTPLEPVGMTNEVQQLATLKKLQLTFRRLLGFILIGLRDTNRSGLESCWEILIEELTVGERY